MTWTCPNCDRRFARTGQAHVCGTWTVDQHLDGREAGARAIFDRFVDVVASCGPFEFAPTRRQIGVRGSRRIFAGLRLTERSLEGYLDLPRRVESARFRHIAPYTKKLTVHHFVLDRPDQLDREFAGWIRESYTVGEGGA